ncbi:hypothetical protein [Aeromonas simiae]|uniref:hypothetical protein n=1 Tax=Aeromonas simiae TaxID=218936 RepID=UPI00266D179F|nr:hypothetical protein [Aeromonas simiae]MDO2950575.1 hypothetical protein [Aeromonas simiae]
MQIDDVEKFYGSGAAACDAIGIGRSNFTKWKKRKDGVVPAQHAVSFHNASNGILQIRPEDYRLPAGQEAA